MCRRQQKHLTVNSEHVIKVLSHEDHLIPSAHVHVETPPLSRVSVSARRPSHTPVKVVGKSWILLFQHVQEVVPLVFSPGLKPLGPQAQLAFKDIW